MTTLEKALPRDQLRPRTPDQPLPPGFAAPPAGAPAAGFAAPAAPAAAAPGAAPADAGRTFLIDEMHRDRNRDLGAGIHAQEIDMQRLIADRIELHIAQQGAMDRAGHIDVEQAREEARLLQRASELARIERDHG